MKETQLKRTPLFDTHNELGARMVEFGGWEMPVLYSGIAQEHHAVRQAAGLFDISHMGEFLFDGPDALKFLNQILTNDLAKLEPRQGQYTLLCQDNGGVIDDLYAYRLGDTHYLLIVNASRLEIDWMWIKAHRNSRHKSLQLEMSDRSGGLAAMALQGPKAAEIIAGVFPSAVELRKNQIAELEFAAQPPGCREPATPARTASNWSYPSSARRRCGISSCRLAKCLACCRPAWARATPSAPRPATRSTATS